MVRNSHRKNNFVAQKKSLSKTSSFCMKKTISTRLRRFGCFNDNGNFFFRKSKSLIRNDFVENAKCIRAARYHLWAHVEIILISICRMCSTSVCKPRETRSSHHARKLRAITNGRLWLVSCKTGFSSTGWYACNDLRLNAVLPTHQSICWMHFMGAFIFHSLAVFKWTIFLSSDRSFYYAKYYSRFDLWVSWLVFLVRMHNTSHWN